MCTDCWFWREMSCALANPVNGACANRRPVRGRSVRPVAPTQAQLVPLAVGHHWQAEPEVVGSAPASEAATARAAAVANVAGPHTDVARGSAVALAERPALVAERGAIGTPAGQLTATVHVGRAPFSSDAPEQTFTASELRQALPTARDIRAARAVAATRGPVAEVVVPVESVSGGQLSLSTERARGVDADCIDQLVERVRRRTAARLSRRD